MQATDLLGKVIKYVIYAALVYNVFFRVTEHLHDFDMTVDKMTQLNEAGDFLFKNGTVSNSGYSFRRVINFNPENVYPAIAGFDFVLKDFDLNM